MLEKNTWIVQYDTECIMFAWILHKTQKLNEKLEKKTSENEKSKKQS